MWFLKNVAPGLGLSNIRMRAEEIGATLEFTRPTTRSRRTSKSYPPKFSNASTKTQK